MADVVDTAGRNSFVGPADKVPNYRREALRVIHQILRKPDANEEESLDALESLIELSKE